MRLPAILNFSLSNTEGPDPFLEHLKTARAKAIAARTILELAKVPADECIPMLLTGWRQIKRAITAVQKSDPAYAGFTLKTAVGSKGVIFKTSVDVQQQFAVLDEKYADYCDGKASELPRSQLRQLTKDLEYTVLALERWQLVNRAPTARKVLSWALRFALLVFAMTTATAIAVGLYLSLAEPDPHEGLNASYYVKRDFKGHVFKQIDHKLSFNWGTNSPLLGVPADNFSVRWQGCLIVDEGDAKHIIAGSDDGVQVKINGKMFVDNGGRHVYEEKWSTHRVPAGIHAIEVEYQEGVGKARVYVGWAQSANSRPQKIPCNHLIPLEGNSRGKCPFDKLTNPAAKAEAEQIMPGATVFQPHRPGEGHGYD